MSEELEKIAGRKKRFGLSSSRAALIKDILDGMTSQEIAKKYEVTPQAVNQWKRVNKSEIAAAEGAVVSVAAMARFARREERIHFLSDLMEEVNESRLRRMEKEYVKPGDDKETDYVRELRGLAHDIQEEMGQLLPRATDQATSVTIHNYHGISPEELNDMHKPFKLEKSAKVQAIEARAAENTEQRDDAANEVIDAEVVNGPDEVST